MTATLRVLPTVGNDPLQKSIRPSLPQRRRYRFVQADALTYHATSNSIVGSRRRDPLNVHEREMNMLQLRLGNLSHRNRFRPASNPSPAPRDRPGSTRPPIVVCVGFLLLGSASYAASDVSAVPHAVSVVQADEDLRALLLKVEQQISSRRAFSPPDDNALSTWPRVVQKSFPTSPGALSALADFVTRVRDRAADEEAAGRTEVSIDFILFMDLADTILVSATATPAPSSNAQTAASQPMARYLAEPASEAAAMANPIDTQRPNSTRANSGPGPAASVASPAMGAADMNAEHAAPAAGKAA
jgi:hypothetical protein